MGFRRSAIADTYQAIGKTKRPPGGILRSVSGLLHQLGISANQRQGLRRNEQRRIAGSPFVIEGCRIRKRATLESIAR
jgi:hypothetical protein